MVHRSERCDSDERDFDIRYGKLQARLFPIHEASFSVSRQAITRLHDVFNLISTNGQEDYNKHGIR